MNYISYYEKLFNIKGKTSKKTVLSILNTLNFKKSFIIFHVGGTNGKGSVANYLEQGFMKKYKTVGLFTSPHILKINERIQINNDYISDQDIYKYSQKVLNIEKNIPFTTLMYIITLLYFQDNNVDLAILEVGIGGSHDNTSFISGEYGLITNVGKDHTEILGDTIEKIALDKSGIMAANMQYFIPSCLQNEVKNIFNSTAIKRKAQIIELKVQESDYKLFNKEFARMVLKYFSISVSKFITPFGRTTLFKHKNITHILDVAHNYSGIKASLDYLKTNNIKYDDVCLSLSIDKDVHSILKLFKHDPYIYQNSSHRSRPLNQYEFGHHVNNLKTFIHSLTKPTLFIGSFYFLNDVMDVINE